MNLLRYGALLLVLVPGALEAAGTLYLSPERGNYTLGEIFEVQILADSGGERINAAEAELTFNASALSVESLSTEGSILESWPTEPIYSNTEGVIRFTGWTDENFSGDNGLLLTVHFRALRNVTSNAHLAAGAILAAQGGSNIITSMRSGVYHVGPEETIAVVPIVESQPQQTPATLEIDPIVQPIFVEYKKNLDAGERIVIQGTAHPSSNILIWLSKDGLEERFNVHSDVTGSFIFTSSDPAKEGVYRVWAQVETERGEKSPISDRLAITVRPSSLTALAFSGAELASAFVPFLIILVVLSSIVGYLLHKRALQKRYLHAVITRKEE